MPAHRAVRRGHEELLEPRLVGAGQIRQRAVVGRHHTPAEDVQRLLGGDRLDPLPGGRGGVVGLRQKGDADGVRAGRRQVEAGLGAQERVRDLDQDAGAVPGARVGTRGAAVVEVAQRLQALGDDACGSGPRSGSRRRPPRTRRARTPGRRGRLGGGEPGPTPALDGQSGRAGSGEAGGARSEQSFETPVVEASGGVRGRLRVPGLRHGGWWQIGNGAPGSGTSLARWRWHKITHGYASDGFSVTGPCRFLRRNRVCSAGQPTARNGML